MHKNPSSTSSNTSTSRTRKRHVPNVHSVASSPHHNPAHPHAHASGHLEAASPGSSGLVVACLPLCEDLYSPPVSHPRWLAFCHPRAVHLCAVRVARCLCSNQEVAHYQRVSLACPQQDGVVPLSSALSVLHKSLRAGFARLLVAALADRCHACLYYPWQLAHADADAAPPAPSARGYSYGCSDASPCSDLPRVSVLSHRSVPSPGASCPALHRFDQAVYPSWELGQVQHVSAVAPSAKQ